MPLLLVVQPVVEEHPFHGPLCSVVEVVRAHRSRRRVLRHGVGLPQCAGLRCLRAVAVLHLQVDVVHCLCRLLHVAAVLLVHHVVVDRCAVRLHVVVLQQQCVVDAVGPCRLARVHHPQHCLQQPRHQHHSPQQSRGCGRAVHCTRSRARTRTRSISRPGVS